MDREWSTSALGENIAGWDWFALQLSDGREVMYGQLRDTSGNANVFSSGTLVAANGTTQHLTSGDVQLDILDTWASPRSNATYPSGWRLRIPSASLDVQITPYLKDQELPLATVYWEGANKVAGTAGSSPVSGNAYVELTGYAEQGRDDIRVR